MELRQHPCMTYLNRPNWPPDWWGPYGPDNPLPKGEVGTLLRAERSNILSTAHCVVVMQWNGREYFGFLYFDEEKSAHAIIRLLQDHIGQPVQQIGSIVIP